MLYSHLRPFLSSHLSSFVSLLSLTHTQLTLTHTEYHTAHARTVTHYYTHTTQHAQHTHTQAEVYLAIFPPTIVLFDEGIILFRIFTKAKSVGSVIKNPSTIPVWIYTYNIVQHRYFGNGEVKQKTRIHDNSTYLVPLGETSVRNSGVPAARNLWISLTCT